jgi:hypothetical protein
VEIREPYSARRFRKRSRRIRVSHLPKALATCLKGFRTSGWINPSGVAACVTGTGRSWRGAWFFRRNLNPYKGKGIRAQRVIRDQYFHVWLACIGLCRIRRDKYTCVFKVGRSNGCFETRRGQDGAMHPSKRRACATARPTAPNARSMTVHKLSTIYALLSNDRMWPNPVRR